MDSTNSFPISPLVIIIFSIIAIAGSLFYGLKAIIIFDVSSQGKSFAWKLHQFWLNFLGSFVGWIALWTLLPGTLDCVLEGCRPQPSVVDLLLFFIAFIGVTGFMPVTIVGIAYSIKEVVSKLVGLLK